MRRRAHWPSLITRVLFLTISLLAIIVVAGLGAAFKDKTFWLELPTSERCENATEHGFLREPLNSTSNLAYFIAGVYILCCGLYDILDRKNLADFTFNPILTRPAISICYGLCVTALGISSFLYHAAGGGIYGIYDVASTSGALFGVLFLNLAFLIPRIVCLKIPSQIFLVILLIFMYAIAGNFDAIKNAANATWTQMYYVTISVVLVMLILCLVSIIVMHVKKVEFWFRFIFVGVVSLGIAVGVWFPEEVLQQCPTASWPFQPLHSLWHFFTGLLLLIVYLGFRSSECSSLGLVVWEKPKKQETKFDVEEQEL